jgi:formylglycine-generating enzyme required for sulfatase activity
MYVLPMAALLMVFSPAAPGESQALDDLAQFRECDDACPEMVVIPAGTSEMGARDDEPSNRPPELPQHHVKMGRFAIGKFEVSAAQWAAFAREAGPRNVPSEKHCTSSSPRSAASRVAAGSPVRPS